MSSINPHILNRYKGIGYCIGRVWNHHAILGKTIRHKCLASRNVKILFSSVTNHHHAYIHAYHNLEFRLFSSVQRSTYAGDQGLFTCFSIYHEHWNGVGKLYPLQEKVCSPFSAVAAGCKWGHDTVDKSGHKTQPPREEKQHQEPHHPHTHLLALHDCIHINITV